MGIYRPHDPIGCLEPPACVVGRLSLINDMPIIVDSDLGKELCWALGLEDRAVTALTLGGDARGILSANVQFILSGDQVAELGRVLTRAGVRAQAFGDPNPN